MLPCFCLVLHYNQRIMQNFSSISRPQTDYTVNLVEQDWTARRSRLSSFVFRSHFPLPNFPRRFKSERVKCILADLEELWSPTPRCFSSLAGSLREALGETPNLKKINQLSVMVQFSPCPPQQPAWSSLPFHYIGVAIGVNEAQEDSRYQGAVKTIFPRSVSALRTCQSIQDFAMGSKSDRAQPVDLQFLYDLL